MPGSSARGCASVVLPTCRGPGKVTAGNCCRSFRSFGCASLRIVPCNDATVVHNCAGAPRGARGLKPRAAKACGIQTKVAPRAHAATPPLIKPAPGTLGPQMRTRRPPPESATPTQTLFSFARRSYPKHRIQCLWHAFSMSRLPGLTYLKSVPSPSSSEIQRSRLANSKAPKPRSSSLGTVEQNSWPRMRPAIREYAGPP